MGGFAGAPPPGGGGTQELGDPAMYAGAATGQQPDSAMAPGGMPPAGPSGDFVRSMGRMGMQLKTTLQTLSGQHPEAAEEFRTAIQSIDRGIAKILTTNPEASRGPMAPRQV